MKVYWSIGHDKVRKGAYNAKYDIHEYDVVTELTQYCVEEAEKLGIESILVKSDKLGDAIKEINSTCKKEDLAIELHVNAIAKQHAHKFKGCEVLYYPNSNRGEKLASYIQESLINCLDLHDMGNDPRGDLAFLRKVKCTSIIPEPFFLSNEDNVERFLLNNRSSNLRSIATTIVFGVKVFMEEES